MIFKRCTLNLSASNFFSDISLIFIFCKGTDLFPWAGFFAGAVSFFEGCGAETLMRILGGTGTLLLREVLDLFDLVLIV